MTSRKEIYEKYFNSSIFSNSTPNDSGPQIRVRVSQTSLADTKNDLFNTERKPIKSSLTKKGVNRLGVYSKIYGSDIFCQTQQNEQKKREGVKKLRNANNFSSCMEGMKNNEEYVLNLKNYSKEHRAEKKEYNPDKYLMKESAAERYYKEFNDPHGSLVLPDRCFSSDPKNQKIYAQKKNNLIKELTKYNDCGVDKKKKPGEHEGQSVENKIFVRKKTDWNKKSSGDYHYVESKSNPQNNCKINKQLYLESHIFPENSKQNEKNPNLNIEKINTRIEEEKAKINRNDRYHLGDENQKRDLSNNDRNLWGSVHSKWEKSNLDWKDAQTELMFGPGLPQDVKNNFGPNGPNAFQRKLNDMADTKNKDTINEEKKIPINNLKKPPSNDEINREGLIKVEKIINEIPLKEDKKCKLRMGITTALLDNDPDGAKKAKTLNRFYSNPNLLNKSKNRNRPIITKIGSFTNLKEKEFGVKSGHDYINYVLTYPIKGQFDKYNEEDIKKIFGTKGVHVYDVKRNMFDKGTYNTIKFKVKENEDSGNLKDKMHEISKDFEKQNYKVLINKEEKKDIKKTSKNMMLAKPGSKLGIINENVGTENNVTAKLTKIPDKIRYKNSFSKIYGQVDYEYKKK
jgi:hypothetical protein